MPFYSLAATGRLETKPFPVHTNLNLVGIVASCSSAVLLLRGSSAKRVIQGVNGLVGHYEMVGLLG